MKKTTITGTNQKQRSNQGQVRKTLRLTKKIGAQRITIDEKCMQNFAVEPAVRSHLFPSTIPVPVLQNSDLLCPQLQSTIPVLATLDSLRSQGSRLLNCKQAVENLLSKSVKSYTLPTMSLERRVYHDLRPLEVKSEIIDKKSNIYLSTATGNAPFAVGWNSGKDETLVYPFSCSPGNLLEITSFNQFIASFNIGLADQSTPENCCVSVAVTDIY